jgi:uroporphyrin-III C-methyltransferase
VAQASACCDELQFAAPGCNRARIMTRAEKGKVYLVGAGPGDPELLTVKASALLASADVVYHDDLVSREILQLAQANALVISVGKRCGPKHITQSEINQKLVDSARGGMSVVRLKSGDPLLFGRAAEEINALTAAAIPYEIVPGITAASAAAAALGRSLTARGAASSVVFLSGHHAPTANRDLPPTRVVYMPGANLRAQAEEWLQNDESPDLPCVLISRISQPEESILRMPLRDLAAAVVPAAPALLIAGWAVAETPEITTQFSSGAFPELPPPIAPPPHTLEPPS